MHHTQNKFSRPLPAAVRPPIQRTLIITIGSEAEMTHNVLAKHLHEQQGPTAALAHIHYAADRAVFITAVKEALMAISPTTLATKLNHQGWQLAAYQEITLFLLCTASAENGKTASTLVHQIPNLIQQQLGLSTNVHLIWLTPNPASPNLDQLFTLTGYQNLILLSPLNEDGLQLPTPETLPQLAADLLWLIITTPIPTLIEDDLSMLQTAKIIGLNHYQWSRSQLQQQCLDRWLTAVFDQWLTIPPDNPNTDLTLTLWLQQNNLLPAHIKTFLQANLRPWESPSYPIDIWEAPWPWQIADYLIDNKAVDSLDSEQLQQRQLGAEQLLDDFLCPANKLIKDKVKNDLNQNPIASIERNSRWLQALSKTITTLYEQELNAMAEQEQYQTHLADERGLLEAQIQTCLEHWPARNLRHWFYLCWQPWRWPHLIWYYWQLCQLGQQLTLVLIQQAQQRRQVVLSAAVRRTLLELDKLTQHWQSHVEEIGEMITYLKTKLSHTEWQIFDEAAPYLQTIYDKNAHSLKETAQFAASIIGGLGTQLEQLDDAIIHPLYQAGIEQLSWIQTLTAVDILSHQYPNEQTQQQWFRTTWQAAAPLWPLNEAQIPQTQQITTSQFTIICGAGATQLPTKLPHAALSTVMAHQFHTIETPDHEQLTLLRCRIGLPLEALSTTYQETT